MATWWGLAGRGGLVVEMGACRIRQYHLIYSTDDSRRTSLLTVNGGHYAGRDLHDCEKLDFNPVFPPTCRLTLTPAVKSPVEVQDVFY